MNDMFETVEERVRLLKRGFTGKDIEKAYLMVNDIRLINRNVLYTDVNKTMNTIVDHTKQ